MNVEQNPGLRQRAAVHSALGEPARLAIVDCLMLGDAAPSRLQVLLGMSSNLMSHHLGVLERAGVVRRTRSQADRRRIYLSLQSAVRGVLAPASPRYTTRVVFVCTENAARSQLAAALWAQRADLPVTSAGTHPAAQVHPHTLAAARRHNLPLSPLVPRRLEDVIAPDDLVVAVCDRAYEYQRSPAHWLHWSVPDPVGIGHETAFDLTLIELDERLSGLIPAVTPHPHHN